MSEEGAIEHPLSTHSAPFGTRWKPAGNKQSISMRSFTRLAAMVTLLLTLACGNVWGTVKSTFTKGETIFIIANNKVESAWDSDACVKAWFNKDGASSTAASTTWLVGAAANNMVFYTIVPAANYNQVQIQRFASNCSTWWNASGDTQIKQSDRGSDDYNCLYSKSSGNQADASGWKNMTFSFNLWSDVNSWGSSVGTFVDKGDGYFECVYTFTATGTYQDFKARDCWNNWYGSLSDGGNFRVNGFTIGQTYTVVAAFNIQNCNSSGGKTDLNVMMVHEPGYYVSASGYNVSSLSTYDNKGYEWYGVYKSGSNNKLEAGCERVSSPGSKLVADFNNGSEVQKGWVFVKANANTSGDVSATNVFPKLNNAFQVNNTSFASFCVKGYNQFQVVAADANATRSNNKYLKVIIDGVDVTTSGGAASTSGTIRAFTLTAGDAHIITLKGTSGDNNKLWGFSFRPATPTITAESLSAASYDVGDAATALSVTATKLVSSGTSLSYQWYSNTTASNSGGTIIDGATSSSYTPPTTAAGTTYYYCVVSETGCNSATSNVSGAITVNAAACAATSSAGADKSTTVGVGVTMAATAATSGYTGAWSIKNGSPSTSTSQLSSTSAYNATFTPTASGTYTLIWTVTDDSDGSCYDTDEADVTVTKNTPTSYTVSGGGTLCSGGDADITLSGSQSGISYQLYNGASTVGDAVSGTGSALTWADQDDAGTYTVKTVANTTYSAATMSGSATIAFYDDISIGTQPTASVNAIVSSAASLSGLALASGTFNSAAYQWQTCDKDDASGTNTDITSGSAYANYNTATLSFTPASAGTYYFRCVVSDDCGNEEASNVVTVTAVNSYTVTYNKNGATSGTAPSDGSSPYSSGSTVTVKDTTGCKFVYSGYVFRGWNTANDGSGTYYAPGDKFTISSNTTLYAVWVEGTKGTVTYNLKTNSSATTLDNCTSATPTSGDLTASTTINTYGTAGASSSQSAKTDETQKLKIDDSYTAANYYEWTCAIASGKTFTPSQVVMKFQAVSDLTQYKVVLTDGTTSYNTNFVQTTSAGGTLETLTWNIADGDAFAASSTMKLQLWAYKKNKDATAFRLGSPILINGVVGTAACSAPAAPTISGTTSYTYGGTISLTATCATGTDASTTYTWYKGSDWATASASSPVQAASTSGATFSKTAAMSDAGTYWCEAANSTCTSHNSSGYAITVAKASISPSLSYSSTTLTTGDNSSSPTVTGNSGSGSVSYAVTSSSPSGCITVNGSTGVVTAVAAGTGTVTATIAATDNYLGGTATADFTVTDPCFYANDLKKKDGGGDIANNAYITASLLASGTITGGTLQNTSGAKLSHNKDYGLVMESGKQVTLTLTSPKIFEAGTVITVKSYSSNQGASDKTDYNKYSGIIVGTHKLADSVKCTSNTPALFTQTYTVTTSDGIEGGNSVVFKRTTAKTYIYSIKVTGCGEQSGYTVTYDDNGSTSGSVPVDSNSPYDEDATVTVLGNTGSLAKSGYTFAGWNTKSDGSGADKVADDEFTITQDTVLYAKWSPNTYTITYNLNGASWAGGYSAPANYTVGTGATLPIAANMTNTGYSFNGWKNNSGLTGDNITAIGTSEYGNKEFWAKWTENTYTITYNANGGSGSTTATEGHYVTVANNGFALEDHVFAGWNTAANGSGESYSEGEEIELTANMTLYAIWADDYNVTWGDVQIGGAGDAVTPNLGGKNYTITATIATWTGDVTDIELGDVTSGVTASITGTTSSPSKTVTITFAVGTSVVGSSINLSLNVPAHGDYGAKTSAEEIDIERCEGSGSTTVFSLTSITGVGDNLSTSGKGVGASYDASSLCTLNSVSDGVYVCACSSSGSLSGKNLSYGSTNKTWSFGSNNVYLALYSATGFAAGDVITWVEGENKSTSPSFAKAAASTLDGLKTTDYYAAKGTYQLTMSSVTTPGSGNSFTYTGTIPTGFVSSNWLIVFRDGSSFAVKSITVTRPDDSELISPTLTWSPLVSSDEDWDSGNNRLNKKTSDADFTFTATQDKNSLGAITYASSNTSVVTVNATTGKVHVEGAGDATITATLAESGCYNKATATYAIHVVDDCDDEAGTISTEDLGCDGIRMTVSGHTAAEGVSYQWYKVGSPDTEVSGATSASYTATAAGEYYVIVTNTGDRHCAKTSTNTVVIAAKAAVTASKIVDSWYVKNGRRTPDIALVQTTNTTDFTVAFKGSTTIWDPTNSVSTGFGGCPFRLGTDGIIYLDGQSSLRAVPTGMTVGDTTITITAKGCGAGNNQSVDIKLHVQAATDHPSVAYVSLGTAAGAVTDTTVGYYKTAALYKYLDYTLGGGDFDLTAQNAYWSVDEKELKQHYSQFDAILITDDPSTDKSKKVDGKDYSYINAIGCLIDVRPILTMEAYVAKRDNWKAKGITGTPESPNPRQYGMKLQCKQHAIFSGVNSASSNVEVETIDGVDYWTVLMVDSTMSPYTGVDWNEQTAGDQKPALQGFAASSVSEDLLLLGEIKDGALYAGVERQTEPAARLLVLGINAKALPSALTAEGKLILKNSLHYLLETDLEKVDDCSNYFTGATDSDWNKATNWSKGQVPNSPTIRVRILKPCEISSGTPIKAASVDIATSGKSYHLSGGTCSGKLTINAGGALIVGGEVRSAVAPNFNSVNLKPTTEDDLILNTSSTAQSALILNNDDGDTKATVNLYSLGRTESSAYQFQYFAVPMSYIDVNPAFAGQGIYTYVWTEASGWERRGYYKGLEAFEGVGITTTFTEAKTYQMKGTLASTEEREITLTTGGAGAGQNIIGNSWLSPIDIASLKSALLEEDVDEVVYIYCTGNDGGSVESGAGETPGQWLAIPIEAAAWSAWEGLKVIPAMQGFCIIANSETTLTLNYNDHVRSTASDKLTPYLRAPKREASHEGIDLIRIRVADSQTHTDLYLFEGESFSEEFDNGWEAKYMSGDGRSAKLYAETTIGQMAVAAQPEYEGTVLGFAPGKETEYTFTFSGPNKEYYLNDLKEKKSTLISEDESYMFTFEEGDTNRFYISKTPINAPSVATGTENTGDGAKARKVLVNDKLYIILNGRVYSAEGVVVK